jgi:short-subunit dehydrogenase
MKLGRILTVASIAGAGLAALLLETRRNQRSQVLAGKTVFITGGSRGFGLAIAQEFGRRGARLVLVSRHSEDLEKARRELLARGMADADILTLVCDLKNYEQTQAAVSQATGRFGQIDILINNAGIITVGPVENQPLTAFYDAMESNYYTMLHTTLAVLPQMLARREGSIANITSIGGKLAMPHLLPYSASKFAAVGFSQGLAAELRSKGIRVTTVCPGLMRTGSHVYAKFTGNREREYRWFSLGASMPGISASASRAAARVVNAVLAGETEIAITPQAAVIAMLAQVAPAYTVAAMQWVNNKLLPAPAGEGADAPEPGSTLHGKGDLRRLVPLRGREHRTSGASSASTAS